MPFKALIGQTDHQICFGAQGRAKSKKARQNVSRGGAVPTSRLISGFSGEIAPPDKAPPNPKNRRPRTGGNRNGAGSKTKQEAPVLYTSPDAAARAFGASAHRLSVYDGRRWLGTIVDQDIQHGRQRRLSRAWAFDVEGRPLGVFANRREAIGAVTARDVFETQTRASAGNVTTDFVATRREEAMAAESAWKRSLPRKARKTLPRASDWQGQDGRTRIAPDAASSKAAALTRTRTKRKARSKPRVGAMSKEAAAGFVPTTTLIKKGGAR